MHEEARRAGRRQGGRDLVADMPGLAHAGDNDAALAGLHQFAGTREARIQPGTQGGQRIALDVECASSQRLKLQSVHGQVVAEPDSSIRL